MKLTKYNVDELLAMLDLLEDLVSCNCLRKESCPSSYRDSLFYALVDRIRTKKRLDDLDTQKLGSFRYADTDTVKVTLCRDCKSFRESAYAGGTYCDNVSKARDPEDYCSRAIRRNDDV